MASLVASWAPPTLSPNFHLVFEAQAPTSAGVSVPNNEWVQIKQVAGGLFFTQALLTDYIARFGALSVGQRIWLRARTISALSGQASAWQVTSAVVT